MTADRDDDRDELFSAALTTNAPLRRTVTVLLFAMTLLSSLQKSFLRRSS